MTRLTVSLAEQPEEIYIQKPAYDSTQYVSDVGGSAGLILGISAATLLGVFENGVIFLVIINSYVFILRPSRKNLENLTTPN